MKSDTVQRSKRLRNHLSVVALCACLPCALAGVVACSSDTKPPAGGGSSGTSLGIPTVGSEGGDASEGGGDASTEGATNQACNPLPNNAPSYMVTYTADPQPTTFVGGVIADGTYFVTAEAHYEDMLMLPSRTAKGITFTKSGDDIRYGIYDADGKYIPLEENLTVQVADPDAGTDGGAAPTSTTLVLLPVCPVAGGSLGPQSYSVVGKALTISFGVYTVTYTLQ
ncbi:MAG: hypothetical protein M3Y06_05310 [Actinomycetota bacterium]|nr:hypothetical protein [Actinomycetota bacterium]